MPSNLLQRYFQRQWLLPILGALLFYGGLLLANELVNFSQEIFRQGAPLRWLFPLLLTSLPYILGMVLPMAAVLGGLLGTQGLAQSSELVAAQGLGVGARTLIKPWARLALVLVLLAGANANALIPAMNRAQAALKQHMTEEAKANFLKPGAPPRVVPTSPEHSLWVSPEGAIHVMEATPQGIQHLRAAQFAWALEIMNGDTSSIILKLKDLNGCIWSPSADTVIHLHQASQELRFALPPSNHLLQTTPLRFHSTASLLGQRTPAAQIELAQRLSLPLSTAALLLLGIALGFGHPRFQSGGAILKSLGAILLFYLLYKTLENKLASGSGAAFFSLLALPWGFLLLAWGLLVLKLRPHHTSTRLGRIRARLIKRMQAVYLRLFRITERLEPIPDPGTQSEARDHVLARWAGRLWFRNWAATLSSLLLLYFLAEYANLAGDLAKHQGAMGLFLAYWAWSLPPFLGVALPVSFLLGSILALSQAAMTQEWNAMKAGGVSLIAWIWSAHRAWGLVLVLNLGLQIWIAPLAINKENNLYAQILKRPRATEATSPWLYLGSTGVMWYLDRGVRWGFPLKAPGDAPVLLRWKPGRPFSEALTWGGLSMVQGPPSDRLFPDRALRDSAFAEETSTPDLLRWQQWAPDSSRAALLWARLFGWLAGPCLVFALLSFAFPAPRTGRGQAMGMALVGGLLYLGLQTLFMGAARAGELPAPWGILAPYLLLLGYGLWRLPKVRT